MHTTLTSKGQMTLPAAVRSQLGLEAGDQLSVTVLDAQTIVLTRRASRSVATLRGFLPRPVKALTLQQMDDGVAAHLAQKRSAGRPGR
ncbi:MAG TPA: AbrB/MazE/SpoVT family DNA-binding domain-containing protein [Burkholderiaceae bacterium]|nr:AbrB/MazE/SpoVT family DNA-binding domain-containing protein [Burkholderiaceae bacterium]